MALERNWQELRARYEPRKLPRGVEVNSSLELDSQNSEYLSQEEFYSLNAPIKKQHKLASQLNE